MLSFVSSCTVQWTANATNDMLADAVLTVILQVDTSPASETACKPTAKYFTEFKISNGKK